MKLHDALTFFFTHDDDKEEENKEEYPNLQHRSCGSDTKHEKILHTLFL